MIVDITPYHEIHESENAIIEADNTTDLDIYFDTICASADSYNESVAEDLKNVKDRVISVADLWKQWKKSTESFVNHKWIYRYVDEKQKNFIKKHYDNLCAENINYSTYKRSFATICKFFGIPMNTVVIENMGFSKDKQDKNKDIVSLQYSKGLVKVTIPDGIKLIHSTTAEFDAIRPVFRSKIPGKYMYPSMRCYFTCVKAIDNNKAGLEGQKTHKYTPKQPIRYAYIDPACSEFKYNAVYVESETPIPVEDLKTFQEKVSSNIKEKFGFNKKGE